ncbi:MAG: outer membrane protein assembly factor BamA [Pseudomonadota bacterium]
MMPTAPAARLARALRWLCLVCALALPSSAAAQGLSLQGVRRSPDRPTAGATVGAVELGGAVRVDTAAVQRQIRLKAGARLDPAVISADIERIFAMGLFDDVRVGVRRDDDGRVVVRYQVLERPSVARVVLDGNTALSQEAIEKVISLRAGDLFQPADAQETANKIRDLYVEEGYFLAKIEPAVKPLPQNQVEVRFKIEERAEIKVRSVEILGNKGLKDEEIKGLLKTREGSVLSFLGKDGAFKRENLEYDSQVIQYLYLTRGYIQVKVDEPQVSLSQDMRYVRVTFRVHEGPQFRVGKVDVSGDSVVPKKKLLGKLALKKGDIFNYALVQKDAQFLSGQQKEFGYAFATVSNESLPSPDGKSVDWTYHVQKGKKVYFGSVRMVGAETTRDKVIRRELRFAEGELYSESKIERSRARIQRLGFFDKVEIKTRSTGHPQVVDVDVEVKERTTGTFQIGAGFSTLDNFITTAQIAKDNFLGRGQRLSLQASISSIRTMFQGSFFEPYFLDTNVTFAIELYNFQQIYSDFTRTSLGGNLSWGYRFTNELMADFTYNLERVQTEIGGLNGRRDVPIASLFNSGLTSSVRLTLTYDSRNDRFLATNGWFASATAEFASAYLLSQNEFNRYTFRLRRYFPLPLDGVLKFNFVGGVITAPQGQRVPLFERFFMGGIFDVRGFQRNTLGPKIGVPASSDPAASLSPFNIGGNKQLYLNNEIEVPIIQAPMNLRGLLFFDVGNAFGEGQAITLDQMRLAVGWGIRWFSPVGPLRFEWGVPLDPKPGEDPLVFAFTIGNSF